MNEAMVYLTYDEIEEGMCRLNGTSLGLFKTKDAALDAIKSYIQNHKILTYNVFKR